jgi:hypothetical protein
MWSRVAPIVLGAVVLGVAAYAFMKPSAPPEPSKASVSPSPGEPAAPRGDLPPGHPPMPAQGQGQSMAPQMHSPDPAQGQSGTVTWTVPSDWQTMPNASAMRMATYRVGSAGGNAQPPELTVMRAGGSVDANIERWRGQFQGAGPADRTERVVNGLKVTVVQLAGTYIPAAMMPGTPAGQPRADYALLGAIVDAPGSPYFFKMVGQAADVRKARPSFESLLGTLTPH